MCEHQAETGNFPVSFYTLYMIVYAVYPLHFMENFVLKIMQKVVDNAETIAYNSLNNKQSTSNRRKISWQHHFTHYPLYSRQ